MKILYLLLLLSLVGCASKPPKPETVYVPTPVPVECENPGKIQPITALPVVFVNAKTADGYEVLGLRGDMYSNLSILIKDTERYITDLQGHNRYYRGCIERHNSSILNNEGEPPE